MENKLDSDFGNIDKLNDIIDYMASNEVTSYYEISTSKFLSSLKIDENYYPIWFNDIENADSLLENAGFKSLLEPLSDLWLKVGMQPFSEEEIQNGSNYYFISIAFDIKPLPENRNFFKSETAHFIIIPYTIDGENKVFVLLKKYVALFNIYDLFKDLEFIYPTIPNEVNTYYLDKLSQAIEIICNEFEIETETNKGSFIKENKEDVDTLLKEFVSITEADQFSEENEILEFIKEYKLIRENPEAYLKTLFGTDAVEEEMAYFDESTHLNLSLATVLPCYEDDWKIDFEALADYISEYISLEFTLSDDERQIAPLSIAEKLETVSDFSLLNIDSNGDNYLFFICPKERKKRIVELSRMLNFSIDDYLE